VGRQFTLDHEVRRAGVGDSRAAASAGGLTSYQRTAEDNKAFAARIRAFVATTSPVETERDQPRRDLLARSASLVSKEVHAPGSVRAMSVKLATGTLIR
jgi:hypothetical protein